MAYEPLTTKQPITIHLGRREFIVLSATWDDQMHCVDIKFREEGGETHDCLGLGMTRGEISQAVIDYISRNNMLLEV